MQYLKKRLKDIDYIARQGVIPGQIDTYDLEQAIGRVKELKIVIAVYQEIIEGESNEQ